MCQALFFEEGARRAGDADEKVRVAMYALAVSKPLSLIPYPLSLIPYPQFSPLAFPSHMV